MPTIQYLLPGDGGRLQATRAVALPPPGSPSTRTRRPGFKARPKRTPQPRGFTKTVWQFSESGTSGSILVMRKGICAFTRVPFRRCRSVCIISDYL